MTRHYRLKKDHLRLLDHLHGGAEPPGFEGRRIVPRLQKKIRNLVFFNNASKSFDSRNKNRLFSDDQLPVRASA